MRHIASRIRLAGCLAAVLAVCLFAGSLGQTASRTLADPSTPPPPPTYVPTPIGGPPAPPTTTASLNGTPVATATPTKTSVSTAKGLIFSLDAARVSPVNNPGNLAGLTAVRRGSVVWLMMYFRVVHVPKTLTRLTTYQVTYRGHTVFKVVYRGAVKRGQSGRFSRYAVYHVPKGLPFGRYHYRADLRIGNANRTRRWSFTLGKRQELAKRQG
ncbi:MAG: hypothetical protein ACRDFS_10190 [Chloroflexota bacterium]